MKHKKTILLYIGFLCFAAMLVFLTLNKHSRSGIYNYHSEIWADKAGYYVYLPAVLKYDFEANRFPGKVDSLTGNGFKLDTVQGKVLTKYPYGIALLQLPFYLAADLLAGPMKNEANGFSPVYQRSIDLAAVFYLLLGLFFLGKYLRRDYKISQVIATLLILFLSTHLFYYSMDETGMSHVYSFALFGACLYLFRKTSNFADMGVFSGLLLGLISGLILIIRPTNLLFLLALLFLDAPDRSALRDRIRALFHPRSLLPLVAGAFIVLLPQLLYWKYAHGSFFVYSYGQEGFNWLHPHLLFTWFSAQSGLFLYTPFFVLFVIVSMAMMVQKQRNGALLLILFLLVSYVFSCWWDPGFGCSFGGRSYVEYLAIFSLPLAAVVNKSAISGTFQKIMVGLLILILIGFNLKLTYTFDGCFYGTHAWDWNAFFHLLTSPTK